MKRRSFIGAALVAAPTALLLAAPPAPDSEIGVLGKGPCTREWSASTRYTSFLQDGVKPVTVLATTEVRCGDELRYQGITRYRDFKTAQEQAQLTRHNLLELAEAGTPVWAF